MRWRYNVSCYATWYQVTVTLEPSVSEHVLVYDFPKKTFDTMEDVQAWLGMLENHLLTLATFFEEKI